MKSDLNFLVSYRMTNKHVAGAHKTSYGIIATWIIVIAAAAIFTMGFAIINMKDQQTIDKLTEQINSPEVMKRLAEIDAIEKENALMKKEVEAINFVDKDVALARMMTAKEFDDIYGALPKDVLVRSANYNNGVLTFNCLAAKKASPSQTAENLNKLGVSAKVIYTGFNKGTEENPIAFNVTIGLKATDNGAQEGGEVNE